MIVRIRYQDGRRKEVTYVRMITVYPHREDDPAKMGHDSNPEIVLHFSTMESQVNIDLKDIDSITINGIDR